MAAVLKITDGSEEVNLIDEQAGFILKEWIPAIPTYKNGGVFVDSPLVEGRRLVSKQFGNVTDTFRVDVREAGQDALIAQLQTLRQLLEKAANYWVTEWQTEPVWLEAQASCESNKRYAIIYMGSLPEDDNFYAQPFIGERGKAAMDDLSLVVEHGIWQDVEPGQEGNALEISSQSVAPDNVTYGQGATTTADQVFVANRFTDDDQLTHIYYYDASLVAYSANLINAAVPFALTPNPTEAGDIIYFGVADPGGGRYIHLTNLVFDVGTVSTNITSAAWEYYTGAAWSDLAETDDTTNFTVSGVHTVTWKMPSDFSSVDRNGVTAYWVRFRVVAVGGVVQRPTQQNRYVYSQIVPYISIASTAIDGDLSALIRYKVGPEDLTGINKVIFGSRSVDRGSSFSAFLCASSASNLPSGVMFAPVAPATLTGRREAPSGNCLSITNAAESWAGVGQWSIDNTISQQYHGRFRLSVRGYQYNGSSGDIKTKLRFYYGSSGSYFDTNAVTFTTLAEGEVLDFGQVELPPSIQPYNTSEDILVIYIYVYGNTTTDCYIYDLIMIPIDESFGEYTMGDIASRVTSYHYMDFGRYHPKARDRAYSTITATDKIKCYFQPILSAEPFLQTRSDQKVWFFTQYYQTEWRSLPGGTCRITMQKHQRYLSARGDK